jgi:hypothetical protein
MNDIRTYGGGGVYDNDHFLVIAKLRERLSQETCTSYIQNGEI